MDDEQKRLFKMNTICKALDNGWSVKKSATNADAFEFTKNHSSDEFKGLILFSTNNQDDIQKHLDHIEQLENIKKQHEKEKLKKSISVPKQFLRDC